METTYIQGIERLEENVTFLKQLLRLGQRCNMATRGAIVTWMLVHETLRDVRNLLYAIKKMTTSTCLNAIDPEDQVADRLLKGQRRVHSIIKSIDQTRKATPKIMWDMRFVLWRIYKDLLKIHTIMGQTRTMILEHDADLSPGMGSFDNADDLINFLRS